MKKLVASIVCIIFTLQGFVFASDFRFSPRANKAHLIHWRAWGQDSLAEAKKINKPILLSLSAVWCHWCHVMDETSYSDPGVITFINSYFIPIRVDSDRRPDIDILYNQGGWPSTVVITPEGEVVDGGTYIPPEGMLPWLSNAAQEFSDGKKKQSKAIVEGNKGTSPSTMESAPGESDIRDILDLITSSHDNTYGGFGRGQKFPNPDAIDFLIAEYLTQRAPALKTILTTTLDNMAAGEIHDRVGGGFFRYSTLRDWGGPHYEKMLSVNAGIIMNYASAYSIFGVNEYKTIMLKSLKYVLTNLFDGKTGAFYGSQDADEKYYRETERKGRRPPRIDETVYSDSNAQMISALLSVYQATGNREYLAMARKTADFLIRDLYSRNDGVYHYYLDGQRQASGLLPDNVLFSTALVDLYNETGERRYMDLANDIAQFVIKTFYDIAGRDFALSRGTTVIATAAAGPLLEANRTTSNYRAVILLSRLCHYREDDIFRTIIKDTLAGFKKTYSRFPPSAALYGTALRWELRGPVEITLITEDNRLDSFLTKLDQVYIPEKVLRRYSPKQDRDIIRESGYPPGEAMYLCVGKKCSVPITREEDVPDAVRKFVGYSSGAGNIGR
jgi:uncharacterized protein